MQSQQQREGRQDTEQSGWSRARVLSLFCVSCCAGVYHRQDSRGRNTTLQKMQRRKHLKMNESIIRTMYMRAPNTPHATSLLSRVFLNPGSPGLGYIVIKNSDVKIAKKIQSFFDKLLE